MEAIQLLLQGLYLLISLVGGINQSLVLRRRRLRLAGSALAALICQRLGPSAGVVKSKPHNLVGQLPAIVEGQFIARFLGSLLLGGQLSCPDNCVVEKGNDASWAFRRRRRLP